MVMPVGVSNIVQTSSQSCAHLPSLVLAMEENIRTQRMSDGGIIWVFLFIGFIISEPTLTSGPVKDGLLSKRF
jgi:hypothetical protein